jgi:hypothetical protein
LKTIGLIDAERLKNIPEKFHAQHEFCFHLHDLMANLLVQMELQKRLIPLTQVRLYVVGVVHRIGLRFCGDCLA